MGKNSSTSVEKHWFMDIGDIGLEIVVLGKVAYVMRFETCNSMHCFHRKDLIKSFLIFYPYLSLNQ